MVSRASEIERGAGLGRAKHAGRPDRLFRPRRRSDLLRVQHDRSPLLRNARERKDRLRERERADPPQL